MIARHTAPRSLPLAAMLLALLCLFVPQSVLAQASGGGGVERRELERSEPAPLPEAPSSEPQQQDEQTKPAPSPPAGRGSSLPRPRSDGARPLAALPRTAEEKSRALSDLYAQLAAADSEEAAKKITAQIERIWRHSGSDTVNLLIGRATQAINDKRQELAEKLLDHAVTLAPEYTESFSQRAYYYYKQSNMRAAVGDLRRVLALDPNHFKAMEGLFQIWRDTDNKKAAYEVLKRLLEVHPFAPGAQKAFDDLKREVEGQGI